MFKILIVVVFLLMMPTNCKALQLSAKSACLILAQTGEVVFEKNSELRLPMASTTKMMTALVAAESGMWNEVATVSANAECQEGSSIYLERDDKLILSDLVCGMLLNSGNDAAVAVSEHIAGSEEDFSVLMCEKAYEIGAVNTSYENPSGLDGENHYSTAYDLALIGSEVVKNDKLLPIIQSKEMKIQDDEGNITYLKNHNKLLWDYDGMIGIKTGYTKKSGRCLVTAAERNGITLVAVTLCAPDDWNDHKTMLDYGFGKCENTIVVEKGDTLKKINVGNTEVEAVADRDIIVSGIKNEREEREIEISAVKNAIAPINKGEKLGEVRVYQNGRVAAEAALVANDAVYEDENRNIWFFLKKLFKTRT